MVISEGNADSCSIATRYANAYNAQLSEVGPLERSECCSCACYDKNSRNSKSMRYHSWFAHFVAPTTYGGRYFVCGLYFDYCHALVLPVHAQRVMARRCEDGVGMPVLHGTGRSTFPSSLLVNHIRLLLCNEVFILSTKSSKPRKC